MLDPFGAISVQIDFGICKIIAPLYLIADLLPKRFNAAAIFTDVKNIFANTAFSTAFYSLIHTDQRNNRVLSGLKIHMILVCVYVQFWHRLSFKCLLLRIRRSDLVHYRLPGYMPVCHIPACFRVRHLAACVYQRQRHALADSFVCFDAGKLVNRVFVTPAGFLVVCPAVSQPPEQSKHFALVSVAFYAQPCLFPACLVFQQLLILLLIVRL